MHGNIFIEISLLLAIAAAVSLVMRKLKQPLIIGYIFTGLLVGPSLLGLVDSPATIEQFGSFGIALLLFIVGLGLNPKVIKEVGKISFLTGVGQVIFTSAVGFWVVVALGYPPITAFYIAVALTFSSTIIILKLLTDKKEQNKLHGKIAIGFLLVQDLIATIALVIAAATGQGGLSYQEAFILIAKGIGLSVSILAVSNLIIRRMSNFLAKSQELLFLFALAWGFGIGTLFYLAGFSLEVGALFAGVALASMPYAQEVSSRLRPLRDFFIVVFFIALGAKLNVDNISGIVWQAVGLSLFVLICNPIIMMTIMGLMGYTKNTSFKAGLTVAQISEFSLIFILLGLKNGQVSEQAVTLVTIVGITTIAASSYMIIYSDKLYKRLEKYLNIFERKNVHGKREAQQNYEAVLFGYHKGDSEFIKVFERITKHYVVVDYDPEIIEKLMFLEVPYLYGDATDSELLEEIDFTRTKLVISTITDYDTNVFLLKHINNINKKVVTVCHAESAEQAMELYSLGASYVLLPHFIGTEKITTFLKKSGFDKDEFNKFRVRHLEYLENHFAQIESEEAKDKLPSE